MRLARFPFASRLVRARITAVLATVVLALLVYFKARLAALFATVTVAGIAYFFVAVLVEQSLRPAYNPVQATISELAVGRYGFLLTSGFYVLGTSILSMSIGLWQRVKATLTSRLGLALLALSGVAAFIAAGFPTDLTGAAMKTTDGEIHDIVADSGYTLLILAILALTLHFRRERRWRSYHPISLVLAVSGCLALITVGITSNTAAAGLAQRVMAVTLLAWVALTALRLFRVKKESS
jgi:hypothetical protein